MYACERGHEATALALLDRGAEVNAVDRQLGFFGDRSGTTALMYACMNGHEAIALALLDRGAEVNAVDGYGRTALVYARERGHEATALALNDRGGAHRAQLAGGAPRGALPRGLLPGGGVDWPIGRAALTR